MLQTTETYLPAQPFIEWLLNRKRFYDGGLQEISYRCGLRREKLSEIVRTKRDEVVPLSFVDYVITKEGSAHLSDVYPE